MRLKRVLISVNFILMAFIKSEVDFNMNYFAKINMSIKGNKKFILLQNIW